MFISLTLGGTECILLGVMAIDRYAAVCRPLHYTVIIPPSVCPDGFCFMDHWFCQLLVQTALVFLLPRCGRNKLAHFFCEIPSFLKLACVDISVNVYVTFFACVIMLLAPVSLIMVSYGRIVWVVLE